MSLTFIPLIAPPSLTLISLSLIALCLFPFRSSHAEEERCFKDIQKNYSLYSESIQSFNPNSLNSFWDISHIKQQLILLKVPQEELAQRILSYVMHYNEQQSNIKSITKYHVQCSPEGNTAIFEVIYTFTHPDNYRYLKVKWNKDWKITLASFSNDLTPWLIEPEDLKNL